MGWCSCSTHVGSMFNLNLKQLDNTFYSCLFVFSNMVATGLLFCSMRTAVRRGCGSCMSTLVMQLQPSQPTPTAWLFNMVVTMHFFVGGGILVIDTTGLFCFVGGRSRDKGGGVQHGCSWGLVFVRGATGKEGTSYMSNCSHATTNLHHHLQLQVFQHGRNWALFLLEGATRTERGAQLHVQL